jgi:hypothetical protein
MDRNESSLNEIRRSRVSEAHAAATEDEFLSMALAESAKEASEAAAVEAETLAAALAESLKEAVASATESANLAAALAASTNDSVIAAQYAALSVKEEGWGKSAEAPFPLTIDDVIANVISKLSKRPTTFQPLATPGKYSFSKLTGLCDDVTIVKTKKMTVVLDFWLQTGSFNRVQMQSTVIEDRKLDLLLHVTQWPDESLVFATAYKKRSVDGRHLVRFDFHIDHTTVDRMFKVLETVLCIAAHH